MSRLIWAELRYGWAAWAGITLVAAVASLTICLAMSFLETGLSIGGSFLEGASSFLAALLMFSLPSAMIVVAAVARLAVMLQRATYARWQLGGVSPAQTAGVVLVQLAMSGLLGAGVGFAAATQVVPMFVRAVLAGDSTGWDQVPFVVGPLTASAAVVLTVVVTVVGGARAARTAARVSPLAALRDEAEAVRWIPWWRWALLVAVAAGAAAGVNGILHAESLTALTGQILLLPVYLMVVVASAGPVLYPVVLRAWTALVPAEVSAAWYLARHEARYHLARSTTSITPLFIGASLLGGLMTVAATVGASMAAGGQGGDWGLELIQVMLLIGGPVLLGAVGAAVVIFMSNRAQASGQALLRASGATDGTVLLSAGLQAIIHVVTAGLLAAVVLVATALIVAARLSRFTTPVPVVDAAAAAGLVAVGLALTVAATTLPALSRLRRPVAAELAAA